MEYTHIISQLETPTQKTSVKKDSVKKRVISWNDFDKAIKSHNAKVGWKEIDFYFQNKSGELVKSSRHEVKMPNYEQKYLATKIAKKYEDGNIEIRTGICVLNWVKNEKTGKAELTPVIKSYWGGQPIQQEILKAH